MDRYSIVIDNQVNLVSTLLEPLLLSSFIFQQLKQQRQQQMAAALAAQQRRQQQQQLSNPAMQVGLILNTFRGTFRVDLRWYVDLRGTLGSRSSVHH